MADIIHETLLRVKEAVTAGRPINDSTLLDIERSMKHEHNGYRYTVSKKPNKEAVRAACNQDLEDGYTYKEAAQRQGVSERTVYRRAKEPD